MPRRSCCPDSSAARKASPPTGRGRRRLFGLNLGSQLQVYYVDRRVGARGGDADARVHAHAGRADVQRGAGQSGAGGVRRLQHAARAVLRLRGGRPVRGSRGRPARDQLRDRRGRRRQRAALRHGAADGLHRRRHALRRAGRRRGHADMAADQPERLHRRVAPVSRPLLHGDHPVRALGSRRSHRDARRDRAHPGVRVRAGARMPSRSCRRW